MGALDVTNGKKYVRMLRRAMDLGRFHQVIFICHSPLVWELADDVLSVGDGCVEIGNRKQISPADPEGGDQLDFFKFSGVGRRIHTSNEAAYQLA